MTKNQIISNLTKTATPQFVYWYSPDVDLWFEWNKSQTVNIQNTMAGQDIDCFSGSYGKEATGSRYFKNLIVEHIKDMLQEN